MLEDDHAHDDTLDNHNAGSEHYVTIRVDAFKGRKLTCEPLQGRSVV